MDNLAILRFDSDSKAYQAFSELKAIADAGAVNLHEAAVVIAGTDGTLEMKDSVGFDQQGATNTGSLIGILLGIVGGPLGVLFGWLAGGAVGATLDAAEVSGAARALNWVGNSLPAGTTAVFVLLGEPTPDALDALASRLGGSVERSSAAAVHEAMNAAKRAESAARTAAHATLRDAKPETGHGKWEDVKASIKKLFK